MKTGWQIAYSAEWDGWLVKINGQTVCDESGCPSVYHPPSSVDSERAYDLWRAQLCASIERMSGVRCRIPA